MMLAPGAVRADPVKQPPPPPSDWASAAPDSASAPPSQTDAPESKPDSPTAAPDAGNAPPAQTDHETPESKPGEPKPDLSSPARAGSVTPPVPTEVCRGGPPLARERRPDPWSWLLIEGQLGLGAPLGYLGLSVGASPVPWIELDLGAGLGAAGVQYAADSRLRLARWGSLDRYAFYLGAGVSMGPYNSDALSPSNPSNYHWDTAYWGNLEAGLEIRMESGFSARPFVGAGYMFNVNTGKLSVGGSTGPPDSISPWQPYVGLGLGYSFKAW